MEIQGRTAVITGGARGIGFGIAEALAKAGARIVIGDLGSRAKGPAGRWAYGMAGSDDLTTAAEKLRTLGSEVEAVELDVTEAESCQNLIEQAQKRFGSVDLLVNNAGLVKLGAIASYEEADWQRLFDVNVKGVFLASKAVIPVMSEQRRGVIINIASIAGKRGYAGLAAYCSSKFAVIGLTQALAQELGGLGVRVNAICPGLLATAMWIDHLSVGIAQTMNIEGGREAFEAYVLKNTPLGREQTPADIGAAVLYLVAAENITGVALNVAGGTEMS